MDWRISTLTNCQNKYVKLIVGKTCAVIGALGCVISCTYDIFHHFVLLQPLVIQSGQTFDIDCSNY